MLILGISAYFHDSAAVLVRDGVPLVALQEERFSRRKFDSAFPLKSIESCLRFSSHAASDIDAVVFFEKPFLKFERLLETYLAFAPKGFSSFNEAMPLWLKDKLFQRETICQALERINPVVDWQKKLYFSNHHLSHAASAYFPSPFDEAAIVTFDGVGEWTTTAIYRGQNKQIEELLRQEFPHSLGLLYSSFTSFCGFKVNSGEYKLMGLAPYGTPKYVDLIKSALVDIRNDGSFFLNMDYFDFATGLKMTNNKFAKLFGIDSNAENSITYEMKFDLASSIQRVTEDIILKTVETAKEVADSRNLCLAGGVALNCVANGKLLSKNMFEKIWIQPAAGDSGGALGAALAFFYEQEGTLRPKTQAKDSMQHSQLGTSYTSEQIEETLIHCGAVYIKEDKTRIIERVASDLSLGKSIGWFQGRSEYGPRALGNRSILANASLDETQKRLNLQIKYRESFRPFAPVVLLSEALELFENATESDYMLFTFKLKEKYRLNMIENNNAIGMEKLYVHRSNIPAVTHVDYSARVQTIADDRTDDIALLLKKYKELTGTSVIVNTSFNVRGEPIVNSPSDAFNCFMATELDVLVIESFYLVKALQTANRVDYRQYVESD